MSPTKQPKEPKPVDRNALKRESAGRYATPDGRFEVEQNSGRWMISDTAETNDFGLPLIRGPFATLDEVRDAIRDAREGAAPTSPLAGRVPRSGSAGSATGVGVEPRKAPTRASADRKPEPDAKPAKPPEPAPIEIRRLEPGDDGVVRKLAALSGLASATCGPLRGAKESDIGPIDRESARRLLARADVHIVVALEDDAPIGHILAFELPRLRDDDPVLVIDEVAVADDRRREGIASRLAKALFDVAVVGGVKHVIGFAASDDRAVRAFYRSIGGEPAKDESGVFEFEIGKSSSSRRA